MTQFGDVCEAAARAGGDSLRQWQGRFAVREKGPADLVTEADLAAQEAVRAVIEAAFPDHGFLGEEGEETVGKNPRYRWIVDPLDGTTNYVHGLANFAVSVALECDGNIVAGTVYDPIADECFSAELGLGARLNGLTIRASKVQRLSEALVAASFPAVVQRDGLEMRSFIEVIVACQAVRRLGSAALNLSYLAAGRFDGYWAYETKAWDVAAGVLIAAEAGAVVTNCEGGPLTLFPARVLAASCGQVHAELLACIRRA